jgi:alpha-tubulin suppressor-like RCC1 family protein
MPVSYPYIQYGGIWTTSQATDAVAAGTWAVPTAPHLFSWGANNFGQLGLGNTTNYSSPKQVGALTDWYKFVAGAGDYSIAIKTDGTLWAWGQGSFGCLGLGSTTSYSSPKQVGSLTNWKDISNGLYSSLAIKTDGTLWSWGWNDYGQLGLGNTTSYSSPKQVGLLTDWLSIAASGYYGFLAVKTNGTLWAWGRNNYGQLGLGNTTPYSSPKQVGALTNWLKISGGGYYGHSHAVKTDGTLWSWGINSSGQLGLGNTTNYSSPKQVGLLTNWSYSSSGAVSCLALKTNSTLWSWGDNSSGQLGQGNTTNYSSPKQVGALTDWLLIAANGYFSGYALKTNGTLWSWGGNGSGQLGLGNRTSYSSPKQVGSLTTWSNISPNWRNVNAIATT